MSHRSDMISPAIDELLVRFGENIRRVARRYKFDDADLDMLVQDVRIRIWRALQSHEKISGAPASYVYRTAMSAAVDMIRRRRARREHALEAVERVPDGASEAITGYSAGPDEMIERREAVETLDRAINQLSDSRRPVVRMHLAGYHRDEIADLLGWTEAKTRNLLYRGLADLREALERLGCVPGVIT